MKSDFFSLCNLFNRSVFSNYLGDTRACSSQKCQVLVDDTQSRTHVDLRGVAAQVLSEYASRDECQGQVKKKAAAAAMDAAKGTSLEGCNGLLAELSSLCTQEVGKEQAGPPTSDLLGAKDKLKKVTGKPLIEVIGSSWEELSL